MAIAYSKLPIIRSKVSGANRAELITAVGTVLVQAGWSATETDYGYKLLATSAQGFQAKLWLEDLGATMVSIYGPAISLRMSNGDESDSCPAAHRLVASSEREYTVIAGHAQVFISIDGISWTVAPDGFWGHHFACGIPWLPEEATGPCAGTLSTDVESAWWLSGDGFHSLRNGYYHDYGTFAGYWSTDGLKVRDATGSHLQARILSLAKDRNSAIPNIVYGDGTPLYIDPLLAWGIPNQGDPPLLRGQIWDAVWSTKALDLGSTFTLHEVDEDTGQEFDIDFECWAYTGETATVPANAFGCLCVARGGDGGGPIGASNYAY